MAELQVNKSLLTNLLSLLLVLIALLLTPPWQALLMNAGVFALSGGLSNWLAVYMLCERVPGFYGSRVIALHFESFKAGIRRLVMQQFFNPDARAGQGAGARHDAGASRLAGGLGGSCWRGG